MHDFVLLKILAIGLTLALVFAAIAHKLRISPIVGYLVAGYLIGPYSPGFVADMDLAFELSEAGVILLMFGVGLHFDLKDLWNVKGVALPGAVVQTAAATICGTLVALSFGLSIYSGFILGMCLAVASTVVLMRMLENQGVLNSVNGHIAVGWLVVEDIFTILILVLLPTLATMMNSAGQEGGSAFLDMAKAIGLAFLRLGALWVLVLPIGGRIVPWLLSQVAKTRSGELFTLSILMLAFAIAVGAAALFDTSVALGAFLAGMVVSKSKVSHQAMANIIPMKDTFSVLFFLSIGMLFSPAFLLENPMLILFCLLIVLVIKPLTAFIVVVGLGYSVTAALTVAAGLAQIGEFSFILANQAQAHKLIGVEVYNALVICALVSIMLNQGFFGLIGKTEDTLRKFPKLWEWLNRRANKAAETGAATCINCLQQKADEPIAIVVGYGITGKNAVRTLMENDLVPVLIEMNIDTVNEVSKEGMLAVYGDASSRDVLVAAGIERAKAILITIPEIGAAAAAIAMAYSLNPTIKIVARARFMNDVEFLHSVGADIVAVEEEQVALAMSDLILQALALKDKVIKAKIEI